MLDLVGTIIVQSSATTIGREMKPVYLKTDTQIKLDGPMGLIPVVKINIVIFTIYFTYVVQEPSQCIIRSPMAVLKPLQIGF